MKQGSMHGCSCGHDHSHFHAPTEPHPAQKAPLSILRMSLVARLLAALAVTAGLWAVVALAMRTT